MKKYILTINFLFLTLFLKGQSWYPRFSIPNGGSYQIGVQYLNNNKFIIRGTGYDNVTLLDAGLQEEWTKEITYYDHPWDPIHNPTHIFIDSLGDFYIPCSDPDPGANYSAIVVVKMDSMGNSLGKLGQWSGGWIGAEKQQWYDFNFDKIKNRILIAYEHENYDQNQNLVYNESRFEVYDLNLDTIFTIGDGGFQKIFVLYDGNDSQNYILIDYSGMVYTFDTNNNLLWRKKYGILSPDGAVRIDSTICWIAGNKLFKTDLNGVVLNAVNLQLPFTPNQGIIGLNSSGNLIVSNINNYLIHRFIVSEFDTAFNTIRSLQDTSFMLMGLDVINGTNDLIAWGEEAPIWNQLQIRKFNFDTYCDLTPYTLQTQPYSLTNTIYPNIGFPSSFPLSFTSNVSIDSTHFTSTLLCSATGINEKADDRIIKISPNPANSYFKISNLTFNKGDVLLMTDAIGKCIIRKQFDNQVENYKIETTGISNGIYFIQAKQNKRLYNGKVVLKK